MHKSAVTILAYGINKVHSDGSGELFKISKGGAWNEDITLPTHYRGFRYGIALTDL